MLALKVFCKIIILDASCNIFVLCVDKDTTKSSLLPQRRRNSRGRQTLCVAQRELHSSPTVVVVLFVCLCCYCCCCCSVCWCRATRPPHRGGSPKVNWRGERVTKTAPLERWAPPSLPPISPTKSGENSMCAFCLPSLTLFCSPLHLGVLIPISLCSLPIFPWYKYVHSYKLGFIIMKVRVKVLTFTVCV